MESNEAAQFLLLLIARALTNGLCGIFIAAV